VISYAGVKLVCPTAQAVAVIEARLTLRDVCEFERLLWPGKNRLGWTFPGQLAQRPVRLGQLWWPTGAARFAVGHWLAGDAELAAIRQKVYGGYSLSTNPGASTGGGSYLAQPLILSTEVPGGGNSLSTNPGTPPAISTLLWLLPPKPLLSLGLDASTGIGNERLYLLTLVDDRYFWWLKNTGDVTITAGVTTWTDLYNSCNTALEITVQVDAINAAYLYPSPVLAAKYEAAPLLLDAVAYNCGQRIVRGLDGTVRAMSPTAAAALQATNATLGQLAGGGRLASADKKAQVPSTVVVTFPEAQDSAPTGSVNAQAVSLAELSLPELAGTTGQGNGSTQTFHDQASAQVTLPGQAPSNQSALQDLTKQIATDWYRFQLGSLEAAWIGIVALTPEGLADSFEWTYHAGQIGTRVYRRPWNDRTEELCHNGSAGSNPTQRTIKAILIGPPVGCCYPWKEARLTTLGSHIADGSVPDDTNRILTTDPGVAALSGGQAELYRSGDPTPSDYRLSTGGSVPPIGGGVNDTGGNLPSGYGTLQRDTGGSTPGAYGTLQNDPGGNPVLGSLVTESGYSIVQGTLENGLQGDCAEELNCNPNVPIGSVVELHATQGGVAINSNGQKVLISGGWSFSYPGGGNDINWPRNCGVAETPAGERWYTMTPGSMPSEEQNVDSTLDGGQVVAIPFPAPAGGLLECIAVNIIDASSGGKIVLGVYSNLGSSPGPMWPNKLLVAVKLTVKPGVVAGTINLPVSPGGWYWLAGKGLPFTVQVKGLTVSTQPPILGLNRQLNPRSYAASVTAVWPAFKSLPATFPTDPDTTDLDFIDTSIPIIAVRYRCPGGRQNPCNKPLCVTIQTGTAGGFSPKTSPQRNSRTQYRTPISGGPSAVAPGGASCGCLFQGLKLQSTALDDTYTGTFTDCNGATITLTITANADGSWTIQGDKNGCANWATALTASNVVLNPTFQLTFAGWTTQSGSGCTCAAGSPLAVLVTDTDTCSSPNPPIPQVCCDSGIPQQILCTLTPIDPLCSPCLTNPDGSPLSFKLTYDPSLTSNPFAGFACEGIPLPHFDGAWIGVAALNTGCTSVSPYQPDAPNVPPYIGCLFWCNKTQQCPFNDTTDMVAQLYNMSSPDPADTVTGMGANSNLSCTSPYLDFIEAENPYCSRPIVIGPPASYFRWTITDVPP